MLAKLVSFIRERRRRPFEQLCVVFDLRCTAVESAERELEIEAEGDEQFVACPWAAFACHWDALLAPKPCGVPGYDAGE